MKENTEIPTPADKWSKLKKDFLVQIKEIDKETVYSEVEPEWWLEMMKIRRFILDTASD